jgi:hypothetical protein
VTGLRKKRQPVSRTRAAPAPYTRFRSSPSSSLSIDKGEKFDAEFARRMVSLGSAAAVEFPAPQVRATHPELRAAAASGMTSQLAGVTDLVGRLTGQVADAQERGTPPPPKTAPMPRGTAHAGAGGTRASAALPAVAGAALLSCGAGLGLTLARRRRTAAARRG